MPKVLYEKDGHLARITLNRPEVLNAPGDDLPAELEATVNTHAGLRLHVENTWTFTSL